MIWRFQTPVLFSMADMTNRHSPTICINIGHSILITANNTTMTGCRVLHVLTFPTIHFLFCFDNFILESEYYGR